MLVVDASVLADGLLDDGRAGQRAREALTRDDHWAAPEHFFVEVLSVIRGRLLARKITAERADDAVAALTELTVEKLAPAALVARIWELRANVTAYDAAYVAAAELLDCPLLARDARLARSNGIRCEVRLIPGE